MTDPTIREIIEASAEVFGCPVEHILSNRRDRIITRPRQVAAYLARSLTAHSTTGIGRAMNRDHATVLHATNQVENLMHRDPDFLKSVELVRDTARLKASARPVPSTPAIEIGEIAAALRALGRDAIRAANMLEGLARRNGQANDVEGNGGYGAHSNDQA